MSTPIQKTKAELEQIVLEEIQSILRNNVTVFALKSPAGMRADDVLMNLHLWERLGVAFAALGALRGYTGGPKGFTCAE